MKEYIVRIEHGADGAVHYFRTGGEIVRCKDCRYYKEDERWCRRLGLAGAFGKDGFCSRGERKAAESE